MEAFPDAAKEVRKRDKVTTTTTNHHHYPPPPPPPITTTNTTTLAAMGFDWERSESGPRTQSHDSFCLESLQLKFVCLCFCS